MKTAYEDDYYENSKVIHIKIWQSIIEELNAYENEVKINSRFKHKHSKTQLCIQNIILSLTYPRLDINVSKHLNHLLKAPFCIHPKTGLISVPLNENDVLNFKLENIPEVEETIDSVNKNT
jgi:DNA primase small subunit